MSNVLPFDPARSVAQRETIALSPLEHGGGGGNDDDMEVRLAKLEAIISTLATKADVEKGFHEMVKWIVGTTFVGVALFITIMTFVLNNAVPKASTATTAPAPIVIQVPSPPPPAQPPPQAAKQP